MLTPRPPRSSVPPAPAGLGLRRWVTLVAALLVATLAFDSADLHDPAAVHSGSLLELQSGVQISEGASHPREPRHLETSQIKLHPGCPACLLELQGRGSVLAAPPPLPPLALRRERPLPAIAGTESSHPRPSAARGPPASPLA